MSVITPTVTPLGEAGNHNCRIISWANILAADTCLPVLASDFATRCVQIEGTFDSGTIVIKGSNDGTNYETLTDPQGNAISKTSAALETIEELTRYIKPTVSGGGGSQSVTVTLLVRR